ncbi:nucleolar protein dao-5-like [Salvia splendens]|uniref:nucleolar protein dao-5-like n=1 Tax=Salvia splendens TaxID=180675 RepID=UPI001C2747D2|nr:nucleolar protein dao-5-like [Salvia splendens]
MKKSKFMQNSKDMLSRSFNPTKCKISLKLAASRLKLLRNKKEVQVKQMKREIAQLLETGQDQTAKIRVEHVIREEKMMGAYDLLEIYCELIVARLPIIETQKNCPIDMKEAIASMVFASPRCGDVPELLDVRKQFSAKYGKEFITSAIELRPQCGVSRLLVEKLSATAPDGQAKIKVLSALAEEHNVKWDPDLFEEKRSGGTSSIKNENVYSDSPRFEDAEVHAHPSNSMNSSPLNSVQQHAKTPGAENSPSARTSSASTKIEPKAGPAGEEIPQFYQGDTHSSHLNDQRWNMEFKDAASAARAAAESAEQASMAARAAAELSIHGRVLGQYSTESHKSDDYNSKGDGLEVTPNLNSFERVSEASANKSSSEYTRSGKEHIDGIKPSNPMTDTRSEAVSFKSKASADDESLDHGIPSIHKYTQENSSHEVQSEMYETKNENGHPEKVENLGKEMIDKQEGFSSSYSQSGTSDYANMFANYEERKFETDIGEDPSVSIGETGIHDETPDTSSHDFVAATFDQSDAESDDPGFDRGPVYDEQDLEFHMQKSPERTSVSIDPWDLRSGSNNRVESASPSLYFTRESPFPDISRNTSLKEDSELNRTPAVRFDDSDGPSSESDEEINASMVEDSCDISHRQNERGRLVNSQFEKETVQSVVSPSKNEGALAFGSGKFSLSSDDEFSSSNKTQWKRSQVNMSDADMKPSSKLPTSGSNDSFINSNSVGDESDPENGEGLNFGKLTGGLRHKGHNHLPFFKSRLDESSSVKEEGETTATNTSSTGPSFVEHHGIGTTQEHKTASTTQNLHSELDSDSSEEEYLQKSSRPQQPRSAAKLRTKLLLGSSDSAFCSDDSDLDEQPPTEPVTKKSPLRSGISRRTKASRTTSMKTSNQQMRPRSEALDSDGVDRKPTTSYDTGAPKRHESYRRNTDTEKTYEYPISGVAPVPAKSTTWGSTEQPASSKTSVMKQESVERPKPEVRDSDNSLGKQPSSSYAFNKQQEFQPSSGKSSRVGKSEQQMPAEAAAKPANSSSWGTAEKPNSGKSTSNTVQKSKISQSSSSSAVEPLRKADTEAGLSSSSENPKASTLDKHSLSKDDSLKKASHVHPKLPDYDALVQSLRINRS